MERTILHCDLNAFYASVEQLLHPELRGKAIAVCGSREERKGIVLTKSEQAKQYGVQTGEAIWQAKQKCPDLLIVPPDFSSYLHYSRLVRELYLQYTDCVEPFGSDECWLDVTGSRRLFGTGEEIAHKIRTRVKNETGLTISVGVSFNKIFAKLGSDLKKPDAVSVIPRNRFRTIVSPLPASAMLGVGRSTCRRLAQCGIFTIGDLAQTDVAFLERKFGKQGVMIWRYANGCDTAPVNPYALRPPVKSVGHGLTAPKDLENNQQVRRLMEFLTQDISHQLRQHRLAARSVQIVVKNPLLSSRQFQMQLETPTQSFRHLTEHAFSLFCRSYDWHLPVRAVTVRAIDLVDADAPIQHSLWTDMAKYEKQNRMELAVEQLRARYGTDCINLGSLTAYTRKNAHTPEPAYAR